MFVTFPPHQWNDSELLKQKDRYKHFDIKFYAVDDYVLIIIWAVFE